MDRRSFLKTAGIGAATLATSMLDVNGVLSATPAKRLKNWAWITINTKRTRDEWKRMFGQMRESGVSAILPEIYDGRHAYFASSRLPVQTDLLGTILPLAKSEGLEVHAWMWSMPCMIPEIMQKHPDWYNVNARGESAVDKPAYVPHYKFLDPGRPEVREWVQGTVKELASISGLAGVHLDYMRHPDAILPKGLWAHYKIVQDKVYPPYDYGYTEYERKQFKQQHGVDPINLSDPNANAEWLSFRCDTVVDLVNEYLVPAAHAKGKMITAAVFPGPSMARQMVRQDWGRFHLDGFLPMLYHSFYEAGPEWVREQTREGATTVKKPVYSGLFVHGMDEAAFAATVNAALEGGAAGVSIFSADAMDEPKWKVLRTTASQSGSIA